MSEQILPETTITSGAASVAGTVALRSYNTSRQSILIQNLGPGTLYTGGSGVTSATGLIVFPNGNITLDKSRGAAVYCTSSGTCDVRFVEEII